MDHRRSLEQLGRRALAEGLKERSQSQPQPRAASYLHNDRTPGLQMRRRARTRVQVSHMTHVDGLCTPGTQTAAAHARAWLQTSSEHKWKSRRRSRGRPSCGCSECCCSAPGARNRLGIFATTTATRPPCRWPRARPPAARRRCRKVGRKSGLSAERTSKTFDVIW